jgi:hypothetical protein
LIERTGRRPSVVRVIVALAALLLGATALVGSLRTVGSGCAFAAQGECRRILFIGNSYTSVNDLPETFARLARSTGVRIEVAAIDPGGATLADHAASSDVLRAISGTAWTAVVIQEQSEIPAAADLRDRQMAPAAAALVTAIRADRAQPFLFETWAHRGGWPDRNMDRVTMQSAIDDAYRRLAASLGVIVAPAGRAWSRALAEAPAIELWQPDGSHPTAAGTYLAACVLVDTILGPGKTGSGETGGLSGADAATLRKVANETIP